MKTRAYGYSAIFTLRHPHAADGIIMYERHDREDNSIGASRIKAGYRECLHAIIDVGSPA